MAPMPGRRLYPDLDRQVGLMMDRITDGAAFGSEWPPYNLIMVDENRYRLVLAVPGYKEADLEIVSEPNRVTVSGRPQTVEESGRMIHQGVAQPSFKRLFDLADHVRVEAARLEDGLLTIELVRELPEALRPKRIEIAGPDRASAGTEPQIH